MTEDQRQQWKRALADKAAAGRRQRAKRATPQPRAGMIRVNVRPEQPGGSKGKEQQANAKCG